MQIKTDFIKYVCYALFLLLFSFTKHQSTQFENSYQSNIKIDLTLNKTSQVITRLSVVEIVTLDITSESGKTKTYSQQLEPTATSVDFNINIEPGTTKFTANAFSNNGTTLLTGVTTVDIQDDGFEVGIDMDVLNPILAVSPDSITFTPNKFSDSLFITNIGTGLLNWNFEETSLPVQICDGQCFSFYPYSNGELNPGDTMTIVVISAAFENAETMLPINSQVGRAEVHVSINLF